MHFFSDTAELFHTCSHQRRDCAKVQDDPPKGEEVVHEGLGMGTPLKVGPFKRRGLRVMYHPERNRPDKRIEDERLQTIIHDNLKGVVGKYCKVEI